MIDGLCLTCCSCSCAEAFTNPWPLYQPTPCLVRICLLHARSVRNRATESLRLPQNGTKKAFVLLFEAPCSSSTQLKTWGSGTLGTHVRPLYPQPSQRAFALLSFFFLHWSRNFSLWYLSCVWFFLRMQITGYGELSSRHRVCEFFVL